ncbi:MAG: hypothetical protein J5494_01590 [Candidatus Methanomethylophilaceae archaeon]|nr:hypothetical protein [Candidatus Methanomethylophilaceae archaeon]
MIRIQIPRGPVGWIEIHHRGALDRIRRDELRADVLGDGTVVVVHRSVDYHIESIRAAESVSDTDHATIIRL